MAEKETGGHQPVVVAAEVVAPKGGSAEGKPMRRKPAASPAKRQPRTAPAARDVTPLALIARAVNSGMPVETIERLTLLWEKGVAQQAKHEYFDAFSRLQAKLPIIGRTRTVNNKASTAKEHGKVRFRYAPVEQIVGEVAPLLGEEGFSYSFKPAQPRAVDGVHWLDVPCTLHHRGGHEETATFPSPVASAAERQTLGWTFAQAITSAQTYGRRNAFIAVVGIMTADPEGTPGVEPGDEPEGDVRAASETAAAAGAAPTQEQLQAAYQKVQGLVAEKARGKAADTFLATASKHLQAGRVDLLDAMAASLAGMRQGTK
jgi:hypothetical protein